MSIAVLRTFISKRKQEHEAFLAKRTKAASKVTDESGAKTESPVDTDKHDGKPNNGCEVSEETSQDEPCSTSKELNNNLGGKGRELKPPRVLEVSYVVLFYFL